MLPSIDFKHVCNFFEIRVQISLHFIDAPKKLNFKAYISSESLSLLISFWKLMILISHCSTTAS